MLSNQTQELHLHQVVLGEGEEFLKQIVLPVYGGAQLAVHHGVPAAVVPKN